MKSQNLTIVVDGGASGCRLAAFDNCGVQCAFAKDGPASLSTGVDSAWQNIRRGLSSIAKQIGEDEAWLPRQLWMGLAGSLQSSRHEQFLSLIPEAIDQVVITDGHAQLLGATTGKPGICLAVGTGSVMHWLDTQGNIDHAGGWGYPVGDEGSGAWLGTQLVNHYLWSLDSSVNRERRANNDVVSIMFKALEQRIGTDISDIQLWSTCSSSTKMASLAPIVVDAVNQNDELARAIVTNGTRHFKRLIDIAPANLPVFIVGGLANLYRAEIKSIYGKRYQAPAGNALNGLYTFAKQQGNPC